MEMQELKNIWQLYDEKLERSIRLNMHCLEIIQAQKVRSKLKYLFIWRILEAATHLIILWYLGKFLYNNLLEFPYAISAVLLIAFFIIAFSNCIRQIILIKEIDYTENILQIQKKLALLHIHIINYFRLTFLVFPIHLAFPIVVFKALTDFDIVSRLQGNWWTGQLIFSLLLIPLSIWLYREISYKNIHKRWVKYVIENGVDYKVANAMKFIKELDEYKIEKAV